MIKQPGQGYAASLVRAKLVGADSHTKLDDAYAGTDALTRYTAAASILQCFPRVIRDEAGYKALSGVTEACLDSNKDTSIDVMSNDDVADKLWLFSYGEMIGDVYPNGFSTDHDSDMLRSSSVAWWLRSPSDDYVPWYVMGNGYLDSLYEGPFAIAPGFTLKGYDNTSQSAQP